MSDNITVAIKVRPLIKREQDERQQIQWTIDGNSITQIDPETKRAESEFHFDYIFGMETTNRQVFNSVAKPIVDAAMKGFNGTIFAYGQTGSGKTYTMMGTKEEHGVIPLVVDYIFDCIQNDPNKEFLLRVSYIEIYNERVNDLIDKDRTNLKINESIHGHILVDCKEEVGTSPQSVLQLMRKGDKNRRTGETNMNERSSRSHTIFRIIIESCEKANPDTTAKEAQLNLIDLAGSERARHTGATGERFNEGCNINKSLSSLALVIKQLNEGGTASKFVNFRDSKLTRILQASLGGNALTTVICAVTPAAVEETQCTLNFALRAKGVKNRPTVNETVSDKALLKRVRSHAAEIENTLKQMETKLQEKEREILQIRIKFLNTQIISRNSPDTVDREARARRRRTWAGNRGGVSVLSNCNFELPTIEEIEDRPIGGFTQTQQNILDKLDLNQSFGPAFADFEVQLIKDQREKDGMDRLSNVSDDFPLPLDRVTIRENCFIDEDTEDFDKTPTKRPPITNKTPKAELRGKLHDLRCELNSLRELTTLEKQLFQEECLAHENHALCEENLSFIKKSLVDSKNMYQDLNKRYAELQSDHGLLSQANATAQSECLRLKSEIKSLKSLEETVSALETENREFKNKLIFAENRVKSLEEESLTHDLEKELLIKKHKTREEELEASLNLAWKESPVAEKTDLAPLQSIIDELHAKIAHLEAQSSPAGPPENHETLEKLAEVTKSLENSEEERKSLVKQVEELSERLAESERHFQAELQSQSDEYTTKIHNLESILAEKERELMKSRELKAELTLTTEKYQNEQEERLKEIDKMQKTIERLEESLQTKMQQLSAISERFNELREMEQTLTESKKTVDDREAQITILKEELTAAVSMINLKEIEINDLKLAAAEKSAETVCEPLLPSVEPEVNPEVLELEKSLEEKCAEVEALQDQLNKLQHTIDRLKDQTITLTSDRAQLSGEKIALQTLIQEKDDELARMSKLESDLEFAQAEKVEFDLKITEIRRQLNEKHLELEKNQANDHEITKLTDYISSLQSYIKTVETERQELTNELEKMIETVKDLEETKKSLKLQLESLQEPFKPPKPVASSGKDAQEREANSIFANGSYFDNMDISEAVNESAMLVGSFCDTQTSRVDEKQAENSKILLDITSSEFMNVLDDATSKELVAIVEEHCPRHTTLDEKTRLEFANECNGLKLIAHTLKQVIVQLSSENDQLTTKLAAERAQIIELNVELEKTRVELNNASEKIENFNLDLQKSTLNSIQDENHECIYRQELAKAVKRVENLEKENLELSDDLMEKIEELDRLSEAWQAHTTPETRQEVEEELNRSRNLSKSREDRSTTSKLNLTVDKSCAEDLAKKVNVLENEIHELKQLNTRLADLKLSSCAQCARVGELSSKRRLLRSDIHTVNQRLAEFRATFAQECADIEILNSKAREDAEESLNSSMYEGMNVSVVEEKVLHLQNELSQLSSRYQEEFNQLEKLRDAEQPLTSSSPRPRRDASVAEQLKKHGEDVRHMMKTLNALSHSVERFKTHETSLKTELEALNTQLHESEQSNAALQTEIEDLKAENRVEGESIEFLRHSLEISNEKNVSLVAELEKLAQTTRKESESLNSQLTEYKSNLNQLVEQVQSLTDALQTSEDVNRELTTEIQHLKSEGCQVSELTSNIEDYKQRIDILEKTVQELRSEVDRYNRENADFARDIEKLRNCPHDVSSLAMNVGNESFTATKSLDELSAVRANILKEIMSLKPGSRDLNGLPTPKLFSTFLNEIVSMQNEIVNKIVQKKMSCMAEEQKKLIDREKRAAAWGKELEIDVVRLQNDLTELEKKNLLLTSQISKLQTSLLDSDHEKQLMREKMAVMEVDFNSLQTDLDRLSKNSPLVTAEREKQLQEALELRAAEYRVKITQIESKHREKLEELSKALETVKMQNRELKNSLEGLEVNEKQLQTIVDMRTSDLERAETKIAGLTDQLATMNEVYGQTSEENLMQAKKITEITAVLKSKCDLLSQYKTQLETMTDYETLQAQLHERQLRLENYKSEVENLQEQSQKQLAEMKDKLESSEIKAAALTKQLADLTNRYTVVQSDLEQLQIKCENLETENERLARKVRCSTSKIEAERKLEDLSDVNRTLKKNLDGASNRIMDLEKYKTQLEKDLMELKGQFELLLRENNEMKSSRVKLSSMDTLELRNKYENLILEKNSIALELEAKRTMVLGLNQKIQALECQCEKLEKDNKDLDEEMDQMLTKIQDLDCENTKSDVKIEQQSEEIQILKRQLEEGKITIDVLKKENGELKKKFGDKRDRRSGSNSANSSPTNSIKSRQRRNDIFNENRLLDVSEDAGVILDHQCKKLLKKISQLEHDLAIKDANVATLELKIKSQDFPHEIRCRQLKDTVTTYQAKNYNLNQEILKMKKIMDNSGKCINQKVIQRDDSTQTDKTGDSVINNKINSQGIVEEICSTETKILRLERSTKQYKEKCRDWRKKSQEYREDMEKWKNRAEKAEEQLKEITNVNVSTSNYDTNFRNAMKENWPTNLLGIPTQRKS